MRIIDVVHDSIPISRYRDATTGSGGLTTSVVAVVTDVVREGRAVIGYGFASVGRYAQNGLMRERFIPRLLACPAAGLLNDRGDNLDPFRCWDVMMNQEKPGGHGERCVAVGTLDMALWDAAAKIAGRPLHRFLADTVGRPACTTPVPIYASGGYVYPHDDLSALRDEVDQFVGLGFTHVKIKIGARPLDEDLRRVDVAAERLGDPGRLAVDAMNTYSAAACMTAANALSARSPWWFEDICDPLDLDTHARVARRYPHPIAAGEAMFSVAEAALLDRYAGLRRERDVLLFDPVHCYGLPGYVRIVDTMVKAGWPREAFWPHGGHLFGLHVAAGLGLGGAETNPFCFRPFSTPPALLPVRAGRLAPPEIPGIGFEGDDEVWRVFGSLVHR